MLRELLDLVEFDRPIWSLPGGSIIRAGQVAVLLDRMHHALAHRVRGAKVGVFAEAEQDLVPLLVFLDGLSAQITLLPPTLSESQRAKIVASSGTEVILTSQPEVFPDSDIEVIEYRANFSDLKGELRAGSSASALKTRWVLPTSGTTGDPKLVAHTLASLTKTVKHDIQRGREFCWGTLYNVTGFAGLQVFLQAWCGGSCLALGRPGDSLADRIADLAEAGCTSLSATPTMWRKLLMTATADRLRLRQITLGGEIVDQRILDALAMAYPKANIIHIYASTEAGVGFSVRDQRAGFPVDYLHNPPAGIVISIDETNHLRIKSAASEQEYLSDELALKGQDGFVDTGDRVQLEGDRYIFLGRSSGIINVGGNKVHPEEVEDFLMGCVGVQLARVSSRPNPLTGAVVQAEVVATSCYGEGAAELRSNVLARCRKELDAYKVPAIFRVVASIETTNSGKLRRA